MTSLVAIGLFMAGGLVVTGLGLALYQCVRRHPRLAAALAAAGGVVAAITPLLGLGGSATLGVAVTGGVVAAVTPVMTTIRRPAAVEDHPQTTVGAVDPPHDRPCREMGEAPPRADR